MLRTRMMSASPKDFPIFAWNPDISPPTFLTNSEMTQSATLLITEIFVQIKYLMKR
jgi:hypothetical protein